jgi:hypothetical protein
MDQSPRFSAPSPSDPTPPGSAQSESGGSNNAPREYYARKAGGWCTYSSGCPERAEGWPSPTHSYCSKHRPLRARQQRRWANTTRAERTGQGRCRGCARKSATYRCPACKIKDGAALPIPAIGVDAGVDADQWRRDNDGWERYRGKGVRGAPSLAVNDEQDLVAALTALEKGRQAIAYAHSASVHELGANAQREARKAAAGVIAMSAGFLIEVVARNDPGRAEELRRLEREIAREDAVAARGAR